jgi:putative flippase GtrA
VVAGGNTSTSITPNVAAGTIFNYTANSNFTFNSLTSAVAGSSAVVIITQDATGSRTLTSTMKFSGASKTLSTAANSIDIISVFYDGTTYYATLSKGYA